MRGVFPSGKAQLNRPWSKTPVPSPERRCPKQREAQSRILVPTDACEGVVQPEPVAVCCGLGHDPSACGGVCSPRAFRVARARVLCHCGPGGVSFGLGPDSHGAPAGRGRACAA